MAGGAAMNKQTTMVELGEQYLSFRRGLGYALEVQGGELLRFCRYADDLGHKGPITTGLAVRWAKLPEDVSTAYCVQRYNLVRRFAKHRSLIDPGTEIPPAGLVGPPYRRPQPYIYSADEVGQLIRQAMRLTPKGGLRPKTYATLFSLLACTGLRISEALKLTRNDVDFQQGVMTVLETKFNKTRLVPLHPSAAHALRRYSEQRDRYHPNLRVNAFFVTERGTSLKYLATIFTIIELRRKLGWPGKNASHPRTIHGLRHFFAVSCLLRWYREEADIDKKIAALSTYMGHANIKNTYWYLSATPELLALSLGRFERFRGGAR
jgi:integrase